MALEVFIVSIDLYYINFDWLTNFIILSNYIYHTFYI
jgi:hypothetical protein